MLRHPSSQKFRDLSCAGSLAAHAAQRPIRAMAMLMDAQLPSDDEEDEDFDPDKSLAGDRAGGGKGGKGAKRGFMEISDGEDDDDDGGGAAVAAEGVHDMIAAGLANAMDDARYCAASGPGEHDARPAGDQHCLMHVLYREPYCLGCCCDPAQLHAPCHLARHAKHTGTTSLLAVTMRMFQSLA